MDDLFGQTGFRSRVTTSLLAASRLIAGTLGMIGISQQDYETSSLGRQGSLRWWFTDVAGRWLGCSSRWRLGRLGSLCPLRGPHRVDHCIPDATRVTDECVPNQVVHAGGLRVIRRSEIPQHGRSAWIHSDGIVRQGG